MHLHFPLKIVHGNTNFKTSLESYWQYPHKLIACIHIFWCEYQCMLQLWFNTIWITIWSGFSNLQTYNIYHNGIFRYRMFILCKWIEVRSIFFLFVILLKNIKIWLFNQILINIRYLSSNHWKLTDPIVKCNHFCGDAFHMHHTTSSYVPKANS